MNPIQIEASGGCQCGAVRYHATEFLDSSHICHCRMCQKASGNFFAALIGAPRDAVTWTRGTPAKFASSDQVTRGFCDNCGTPLFYDFHASRHICLTTGSLDHPGEFPPKTQFGMEGQIKAFADLPIMAAGPTETTMANAVAAIASSNHQHPDHDTDHWPQ